MRTFGTRAEVFHGTAVRTPGGLRKTDLIKNKHGRIVSRKKHFTAKKENRLLKYGFGTKKGKFGFVKTGSTSRRSHRSKKHHRGKSHRGGSMHVLSPAELTESTTLT
jgi:hypothetical protein